MMISLIPKEKTEKSVAFRGFRNRQLIMPNPAQFMMTCTFNPGVCINSAHNVRDEQNLFLDTFSEKS